MTTYAATKAGVAHLAEGLRNELHGKPITVDACSTPATSPRR